MYVVLTHSMQWPLYLNQSEKQDGLEYWEDLARSLDLGVVMCVSLPLGGHGV